MVKLSPAEVGFCQTNTLVLQRLVMWHDVEVDKAVAKSHQVSAQFHRDRADELRKEIDRRRMID